MKEIETEKGKIIVIDDKSIVFNDAITIIEMLGYDADTIAVYSENLPELFFDLKTRVAGEILQKLTTYNKRIIILGQFEDLKSSSLKDFIYESNKAGKIIFSDTLENSVPLLK